MQGRKRLARSSRSQLIECSAALKVLIAGLETSKQCRSLENTSGADAQLGGVLGSEVVVMDDAVRKTGGSGRELKRQAAAKDTETRTVSEPSP